MIALTLPAESISPAAEPLRCVLCFCCCAVWFCCTAHEDIVISGGCLVKIPIQDTYVRSLNQSVCVGVGMFEALRQLDAGQHVVAPRDDVASPAVRRTTVMQQQQQQKQRVLLETQQQQQKEGVAVPDVALL
jgi:hypothetical protein